MTSQLMYAIHHPPPSSPTDEGADDNLTPTACQQRRALAATTFRRFRGQTFQFFSSTTCVRAPDSRGRRGLGFGVRFCGLVLRQGDGGEAAPRRGVSELREHWPYAGCAYCLFVYICGCCTLSNQILYIFESVFGFTQEISLESLKL